MRAAIVENGVVVNVVEVRALDAMPGLVSAPTANIGDSVFNGVLVPRAPASVVPVAVPMLNARLTLIGAGKMASVRAFLGAIPGVEGEQAREYFEYAQTMRRDHPLVVGIPPSIMSEAEKDALFIAAGALNA